MCYEHSVADLGSGERMLDWGKDGLASSPQGGAVGFVHPVVSSRLTSLYWL
jgi:hypothetical protein